MITAVQYAKALYESLNEIAPKDHDKVLDSFAKILSENGDLGLYTEIEKEYEQLERVGNGVENVKIITAREMPQTEALIKELNLAAGKKMKIQKEIDPELIGGIVIRAGDTLIDASVKRELQEMGKQITGE